MVRQLIPESAKGLLEWFRATARDLPWRRTIDPYAIWVSEIMLQQTQVKTVIPYFERWMLALPDLSALARADTARVLKLWEGLGYYTRARNMQRAAQTVIDQHGGQFPHEFDDILKLPGIGPYTAGAIASMAFNQPRPVLDGNVIRVLTRLFAIRENPKEPVIQARLWRLAAQFVDAAAVLPDSRQNNCSHLNQALMELGALICAPRAPACAACPLQDRCRANQRNLTQSIPALPRRSSPRVRHVIAVVAQKGRKYFVVQRPNGGINGGLWEFPNHESAELNIPAGMSELKIDGQHFRTVSPLCVIRHTITNHRITLKVFRGELSSGSANNGGGIWLTRQQLCKLAFPSAHGKILTHLSRGKSPCPRP